MSTTAFIVATSSGSFKATKYSKEGGRDDSVTAEADSRYQLQRELVKIATASASGAVQYSYSQISPSSAVAVVTVGGAVAAISAGAGSAAPAAAAGGAPAAKKEEKKEEPSEEEEDMGFSLFD